MTHRLNRPLLFVLLCSALTGCKTEMGASYAEMMRVVEPDASCVVAPNNAFSTAGYYDPTIDGGEGYTISYLLKNNLAKAADDVVPLGELVNVHGVVNDVQVLGFEGCWYITDATTFPYATDPNGFVDCSSIPEQTGFFAAPQTALEGGDLEVASIVVLGLNDMRTIFGSNFDPSQIPIEGNVPALNATTTDPNLQYNVSLDTASPADPNGRSAYWGQNYPTTRAVNVTVQMRARAQTQNGTAFHTNWLSYPITVAPGGLRNACGMLIPKVCARGPCANGFACTSSGTCSDGTQCSNAVLPSGSQAMFDVSGACYPAQGYPAIPVTCTAVGCNATN